MISTRYIVLLSLTALSLSACEDIREKYTGERHGEPVVGSRRPPVLNPGFTTNQPAPPIERIVPKQNPPTASATAAAASPYDQYDASGNETGRKNYIKEWMSDKPKDDGMARKSFKGSANAPAPVTAMPKREDTAATPPEEIIKPLNARSDEVKVDSAPEAKESLPATLVPEEDNGVFLPDVQERSEMALPNGVEFAQLQPAAGGDAPVGETPHLANVPKVPEQFKELKKEKGVAEQQMQATHDAAMGQKQRLGEEPTGLTPAITDGVAATPATIPAAGN